MEGENEDRKISGRIRGEDYTAEVRFSQSEYDMVMIQTELYHGK